MKYNVYFLEGGNKGGTGATSISILIFNSYNMKTLEFEFGHDIFIGFKMPIVST